MSNTECIEISKNSNNNKDLNFVIENSENILCYMILAARTDLTQDLYQRLFYRVEDNISVLAELARNKNVEDKLLKDIISLTKNNLKFSFPYRLAKERLEKR